MPDATPRNATILVFGDLGLSPRMLNHASAMAEAGWQVALVGYLDSEVEESVSRHPRIGLHPIRTLRRCPENVPRLVFLLWTLLRLGWAQAQALWTLLCSTPRPSVVLAQNPPTVPTLFVGRLGSRLRRARFLVDWHNLGYSMLALRMGQGSATVRLLRRYEASAGRRADGHLCVSRAMASMLRADFGIPDAKVLHDRPHVLNPPLERPERFAILRSLFPDASLDGDALALHCPTSWTDDEDVGMLLDAIQLFEERSDARLFLVITGRGPRRGQFEARLAAARLERCDIRTAFLSPADYRRLLAAADCGVSLHRSSSGVDLPMKLVDLFGAGTPALALDYGSCLAEQVQNGREALLFRDAEALVQRLMDLTKGDRLASLRSNVRTAWNETWSESWAKIAGPLVDGPR